MTDRSPIDGSPADEIDFALLDRYVAGECSAAEAELVRRWLATHDADARYVDAVRDALPRDVLAQADDADAVWARLARDTVEVERNVERIRPPLRLTANELAERRGLHRLTAAPWLRAAAVVTAMVGAGAGALWLGQRNRESTPRVTASTSVHREYATAGGERAELRLPDGTRVILAPKSRLRLPDDFGATKRTVSLEGQAYFDVVHDARQPFEVRAGAALVRDIGTRFDVRAYAGASTGGRVRVVVAQGKVQLNAAAAPSAGPILSQGDVGELSAGNAISSGRVDLATALAWTRGELVFDNARLDEAVLDLARWYDLDLRIADPSLAAKRLTLTLGAETAPEAIEAVALLVGARAHQRGRVITFASATSSSTEIGR